MRKILTSITLFVAASLLIGCETLGLKKKGRGGYAAHENDEKIRTELSGLSVKIEKIESRLKELEDKKNN